jgi:hypothetical protein
MGLFSPNRKQQKVVTLNCLCIGEDKVAPWRKEESTGTYLLDRNNRLAYDSCPDAVVPLTIHHNGKVKYKGQCAILYEDMSRPFNFSTLNWGVKEDDQKKDVILSTAVYEGCSMAVQQIVDENRFNRTANLLMLALGILGIMGFLAAWNGGVFANIGQFFGK